MKKTKHYKPNCTYVLLVDDELYYIGCHTSCQPFLREREIISTSGSFWREKQGQKLSILEVTEYDSKEEALEAEVKLISEYKEKYGEKCLNINPGNKLGMLGFHHTEESKRKMSEHHNPKSSPLGRKASDETKRKLSESKMGDKNPMYGKRGKESPFYGKPLSEEVKKKISDTLKGNIPWNKGVPMREESKIKSSLNSPKRGCHWYTDGQVNILAKECPEGFHPGYYVSDEKRMKISEGNKERFRKNPYPESAKEKQRIRMSQLKWYNNGEKNVRTIECPEGFVPGRIK